MAVRVNAGHFSQEEQQVAELLMPAGSLGYAFAKRAMDLVFALLFLVVLAPLMIVVAITIKLTSRGGVFFTQFRAGKNGKPFKMYKFRSMWQGAQSDRIFMSQLNEKTGPVFKISDDPRLTPIGRFLRRSSIDELPQLFNVLKGQMSLVGPRPLWLYEAKKVEGSARLRTAVKPGLTCLWQISGRSELSYDEWTRLDLFYIRHRSIPLDLLILIQTLPAVLSAHGAY